MQHSGKEERLGYSIEETNLDKTRAVTENCDGHRFRVIVELAKGCYGNCLGCAMSNIEKKKPEPLNVTKLKEYLGAFIPVVNNKPDVLTTIVNYGIGDYFLYDEDSFDALAEATRWFFDQIKTERNVISISTSLLSKPENMKEKAARVRKHLAPTQVIFDAVIDPERLEEHFDNYTKNLELLTSYFSFVDVAINIHKGLTPKDAFWLHKFTSQRQVLNLDIQYAVNNTNSYRVQTNPDDFRGFWETLWELFEKDNDEKRLSLSLSSPQIDDEMSIPELIKKATDAAFDERVLVDLEGNVWFVAYGLGDIFVDKKFTVPGIIDVQPIGKIENGIYIQNPQTRRTLERAMLKASSGEECRDCEYVKYCYGTGYGWYHIHSEDLNTCGNPAKVCFDMLKEQQE